MPKIITCFKWVIDEAYIRKDLAGNLDFGSVDYKISEYDRNAIEEAVLLQEEYGGSVVGITVGLPEATKGLKDALSRGPEKAYFINDESFGDLEPSQTASIIADAIKAQIEYDLIICGEGSGDLYAQQVGPRLAEKLGIPSISYVQKLEIKDGQVIAERKIEAGLEIVAVPMPVLVTVLPDINSPRIPGLKDTLGASKKPVIQITQDDLPGNYEPLLQTKEILAADMERNCQKFTDNPEDIKEFAQILKKEGLTK